MNKLTDAQVTLCNRLTDRNLVLIASRGIHHLSRNQKHRMRNRGLLELVKGKLKNRRRWVLSEKAIIILEEAENDE